MIMIYAGSDVNGGHEGCAPLGMGVRVAAVQLSRRRDKPYPAYMLGVGRVLPITSVMQRAHKEALVTAVLSSYEGGAPGCLYEPQQKDNQDD